VSRIKLFWFVLAIAAGAAAQYFVARRREKADREPLNDPTLARKVESEIFRPAEAPKGRVDVNAENGVVYLRGEVADEDAIEALVDAARDIDGVERVESLLHTPGTAARMKA
jgi:osmotically-inducible protein OsmY